MLSRSVHRQSQHRPRQSVLRYLENDENRQLFGLFYFSIFKPIFWGGLNSTFKILNLNYIFKKNKQKSISSFIFSQEDLVTMGPSILITLFVPRDKEGPLSVPGFTLCTIFGRIPEFKLELLRLQPGVLSMSYSHP